MNAEVLGRIPERMRGFVAEKQVAGVVTLVARRGRTVHLEAVGQANVEQDRPMRTDALFAIASMTKPIVAVAVMILQDEGKLSVDDPVSKYIPRFKAAALKDGPAEREITIRDLLTHTSGFGGEQRTEETLEATTAEIAGRPLQFQPGTQWAYSPGLNVCGRIIELVSGQAFDAFLAERVFRPLNMVDTTFQPTAELRDRLAQLYEPGPDGESLASGTHWIITDPGRRAPNPSGGLFSTASDVARFGQMILNGGKLDGRRIVSKAAIEQMCRVQTGDLTTGFSPGCGWGLGWCVVRQPQEVTRMLSPGTFGHGGAFGTQYWIDPEREMIFVLMIQRRGFGSGDRSEIRDVFQELAVRAVRD
jgi:CubicO group peptidase (beta-lactamase class C family)